MAKAREVSRFRTCMNYDHKHDQCFEKTVGNSLTVEGESYTVRELFSRHLNMHDPNVAREGFWGDAEDFQLPDFSKLSGMDIFDRQALYGEIEDRSRIARKKIEDYQKQMADAEEAKKVENVVVVPAGPAEDKEVK